MTVTPAQFAVFVTNVNTSIGAVYGVDPVDSIWKQIATEFPCTSAQMTLGWTGLMPKMRPWFGARQPHQPNAQTYTFIMVPYENTYSIDRFVLDDDMMGIYYRTLPDMARQAKRQPDYELRDLIEAAGIYAAASKQLGFGGVAHWSTAHPIDVYDSTKGTYFNTSLGGQADGTVTVGGALSVVALTTIWEYGMTLKGEDGERLGIKFNKIMHPQTLAGLVELMLKSMFFAPPTWGGYATVTSQVGTADNPLRRFGLEPICNEFLNDKDNYFMLDTTKAFKPFIWATREPVRTVPMIQETSPNVFNTHTFEWGSWDRVAPAWNYPFLSHRSGPT